MTSEFVPERIGEELGQHGVDRVVELAGNYAECESRRIQAACQAEVIEGKARLVLLQEKEKDLKERLRNAPPLGDARTRRRRCLYCVCIAVILTVSGFFFALLAFDPFRFGWKSFLYCIAIAVVTPYVVDKFLDHWGSERLLRGLAATAVAAALASLILLAVIRGDILLQQIQSMGVVVVSGVETPVQPHEQSNFYEQMMRLLRAAMALLALAMELGAGLALHDAWRYGSNTDDDPRQLASELAAVHEEMIAGARAITHFQNLPAEFMNGFWRDFYRAMLDGTKRNALTKGMLLLILSLCLSPAMAGAEPALNVVVALDLSRSSQASGPDGRTEHERNVEAVSNLLATVPIGSHVTIIAITDRSFTQPYVLLSAQVGSDAGYFKEHLSAARRQLQQVWARTAERLRPDFPHTDVFGAVLLAGQILNEAQKDRRLLVILSDMRHEAFGFNLESPDTIDTADVMRRAARGGLIASLQGVEVYVAGAVAPGKLPSYWNNLRAFWAEYFKKTGATLKSFSVTRQVPQLNWKLRRPQEDSCLEI